jgi:hypothetical protein
MFVDEINFQIYLRLTRKDLYLPLGLPLIVPIFFLAFFLLVLVLPFTLPDKRLGIAMSFIIIASGIPFYYVFVWSQMQQPILCFDLSSKKLDCFTTANHLT